jgi:hypothetical protein
MPLTLKEDLEDAEIYERWYEVTSLNLRYCSEEVRDALLACMRL